jgi:hypothetical protein
MMMNAAKYSAGDVLRDGRRIVIRALRTDDRADLLGAVERTMPVTDDQTGSRVRNCSRST